MPTTFSDKNRMGQSAPVRVCAVGTGRLASLPGSTVTPHKTKASIVVHLPTAVFFQKVNRSQLQAQAAVATACGVCQDCTGMP
jgi:hypothetical protein